MKANEPIRRRFGIAARSHPVAFAATLAAVTAALICCFAISLVVSGVCGGIGSGCGAGISSLTAWVDRAFGSLALSTGLAAGGAALVPVLLVVGLAIVERDEPSGPSVGSGADRT